MACTKTIALNNHIFSIFRIPMQIKLTRPDLYTTFGPLMRDGQFFGEGTLWEDFVISLNLRLNNDLAVDELVEAGKVDFVSG